MSDQFKNQKEILQKLKIQELNAMQQEALKIIPHNPEVILLSPTGTGKTLAFLLPIMASLDPVESKVQAMIIVPTRELAIQITQVARDMGTGYKVNCIYGGGQSFSKDRTDLQHPPALLIGTPGRLADHMRRHTFITEHIKTLVLDEYDKSIEIGFTEELKDILRFLPFLDKKILTSATADLSIPSYLGISDAYMINHLDQEESGLDIKIVRIQQKDKIESLITLLEYLGDASGLIFCNFKESIHRVSEHLTKHGIAHGTFYGGMEQQDREQALVKFRNGTHQLLIATDLAARGIDVPQISHIIHYHMPLRSQEFTHRNGRTARMHRDGSAYILHWDGEPLPDFVSELHTTLIEESELTATTVIPRSEWSTLLISGGRKDKISKGDIAGWLIKEGNLEHGQLGPIELHQECSYAAVRIEYSTSLIARVDNSRLKKKKVRVKIV